MEDGDCKSVSVLGRSICTFSSDVLKCRHCVVVVVVVVVVSRKLFICVA